MLGRPEPIPPSRQRLRTSSGLRDYCADHGPGHAGRTVGNASVVEDFLGDLLDEPAQIRAAILVVLKSKDAPLTGELSTLAALMSTWVPGPWGANSWRLLGHASNQVFNAEWHGLAPGGQGLAQARLNVRLIPSAAHGDQLLITIETLLTNPRRTVVGDKLKAELGDAIPGDAYLEELAPTPFIALDSIRRLMLDTLATLWGPLGAQANTSIFGQPLGPPADLDLAVFTIAKNTPSQIPINQCVALPQKLNFRSSLLNGLQRQEGGVPFSIMDRYAVDTRHSPASALICPSAPLPQHAGPSAEISYSGVAAIAVLLPERPIS
jgi:hypothetical protein